MNEPIPIIIAVEDDLSEAVVRAILHQAERPFAPGVCLGKKGFGYLKKNIAGFNNTAKGTPILILTDLDRTECAPTLIKRWLKHETHGNLLFRVAVREVESWILADGEEFADYLGVRKEQLPLHPDELPDPKMFLTDLATGAKKRELRNAITPKRGTTAKQGPNYNGALIPFVRKRWLVKKAIERSPSLRRTFKVLNKFQPAYDFKQHE